MFALSADEACKNVCLGLISPISLLQFVRVYIYFLQSFLLYYRFLNDFLTFFNLTFSTVGKAVCIS